MKKNTLVVLTLLTSAALLCGSLWPGAGQEKSAPATGFPDAVLEGDPNFSLTLMLQGDARGNFGPCG